MKFTSSTWKKKTRLVSSNYVFTCNSYTLSFLTREILNPREFPNSNTRSFIFFFFSLLYFIKKKRRLIGCGENCKEKKTLFRNERPHAVVTRGAYFIPYYPRVPRACSSPDEPRPTNSRIFTTRLSSSPFVSRWSVNSFCGCDRIRTQKTQTARTRGCIIVLTPSFFSFLFFVFGLSPSQQPTLSFVYLPLYRCAR